MESSSPLPATAVAAPMRKLCLAYYSGLTPHLASACLTRLMNLALVRGVPSLKRKKGPSAGPRRET